MVYPNQRLATVLNTVFTLYYGPGLLFRGPFCVCHTGLVTTCEQDQDGIRPDPARKLSANLYDIYYCCVYSEKLLMMDRGTVRNM